MECQDYGHAEVANDKGHDPSRHRNKFPCARNLFGRTRGAVRQPFRRGGRRAGHGAAVAAAHNRVANAEEVRVCVPFGLAFSLRKFTSLSDKSTL